MTKEGLRSSICLGKRQLREGTTSTGGESWACSTCDIEGDYPVGPDGRMLMEYQDVGSEEDDDLPERRSARGGGCPSHKGLLDVDEQGRTVRVGGGAHKRSRSTITGRYSVGSAGRERDSGGHDGQRGCGRVVDRRITADEAYEENIPFRRPVRRNRLPRRSKSPLRSSQLESVSGELLEDLPAAGKFTGSLGPFEEDEEDPNASPRSFHRSTPHLDPEALGASIAKHFCAICGEYVVQYRDGVNRHECPSENYARDGR